MPFVVVSRLRLRDPSLRDDLFASAVALLEQAKGAAGNLRAEALAESNNTWCSCSAWQDRVSMRSYVDTDPHASAKGHLDEGCDEATFADWEQVSEVLPDWQTAFRLLVSEGKSAGLSNASVLNATRVFAAPVENR